MKKISLFIVSIVTFLSVSCTDSYNIEQPGQVDPSLTFTDMLGFERNVVGLYASIPYENGIAFTSIFTDEVAIGVANGGQGLTDGTWGYVLNPSSDDAASIWFSNYNCIATCNRILKSAEPLVDAPDYDETNYKSLVAHVRAIRAFCYMQLLSYFSTDLSDDNALGVILFNDVVNEYSENLPKLPRSKNIDIFNQIDADLDYFESVSLVADYPFTPVNSFAYTIIDSNFSTAIRARLAIYRKDYVNAEFYAQQLITAKPLTAALQYDNMFLDANTAQSNSEVIFKLERSINDGRIGNTWASVNANLTGSPFFEVGRSVYNLFPAGAQPTSDVRKKTCINPASIISSDYLSDPDYKNNDILLVYKYRRTEARNLLADIKVFRTSEMLLIKAECQAFNGNLTGAATTIRTLRQARRSSGTATLPVYANLQEALKDILLERRKELYLEGHRYIDIKRLGQAADVTFDRDTKDCQFNGSCSFSNTDHRLTMPIPAVEISANPNCQQNPGY